LGFYEPATFLSLLKISSNINLFIIIISRKSEIIVTLFFLSFR
jgi:hypothetical protein